MIDINKLNNYILDPDDPIKNYEVALDYYNIKNCSNIIFDKIINTFDCLVERF